jgi:RNA polymerase sigma factor (sigma-70 family)
MPRMADLADSDEALMKRYAQGDVRAFDLLYRRHEMRVWRYLERHTGNRATADELMQEVWFAVARDAVRYVPSARFTTWLFTIAHHRMIDSVRARRQESSLDPEALLADPRAGPLAAAISTDQGKALLRAVSQLPEEQRDAFLLQMEGDLGVEEIAAITASSFEPAERLDPPYYPCPCCCARRAKGGW